MSTTIPPFDQPPPEAQSSSALSAASNKPRRALACLPCQQRKVRCDRKNPCSKCIKAKAECTPATLARRRKRFPEKELLNRLREYETLLRQHKIKFEPIHKDDLPVDFNSLDIDYWPDSENEGRRVDWPNHTSVLLPSQGSEVQLAHAAGGNTFWRTVDQALRTPAQPNDSSGDELTESTIHNAWDESYRNDDHLLFNFRTIPKNITSLHPETVHIFHLWQIYLDNINPIVKIIHAPTLQPEIIEASGKLRETSTGLEALMFGIYSAAIMSISDEECLRIFGEAKEIWSVRYQNGCQQALTNARFLRTSDLRVLVALFLYLLSIRQNTDPRSLSTLIGIAARIAQRLGLHAESCNDGFPPFEAEMRRRLWWQIVLFDSKTGFMADYKASTMIPAWDCKLPLNINDNDLLPHLKELPAPHNTPTESLFIMASTEIANFVRHAQFYLDLTSPFLKSMAKDFGSAKPLSVDELEETMENKYLKNCDLQNPLHLISSCLGRSIISRWRMAEHLSTYSHGTTPYPQGHQDKIFDNAIRMIELDTIIQTSSLMNRFLWFADFQFPFPANFYLVHELRRRTTGPLVDRAWKALTLNYDARKSFYLSRAKSPMFKIFSHKLVKAWEERKNVLADKGETHVQPGFISTMREAIASQNLAGQPCPEHIGFPGASELGLAMHAPADPNVLFSASMIDGFTTDSSTAEVDLDRLGFGPIDWMLTSGVIESSFLGEQLEHGTQETMESTMPEH